MTLAQWTTHQACPSLSGSALAPSLISNTKQPALSTLLLKPTLQNRLKGSRPLPATNASSTSAECRAEHKGRCSSRAAQGLEGVWTETCKRSVLRTIEDICTGCYTSQFREKSKNNLGVGGGEVFQGFDLHFEGLVRVHSSGTAQRQKGFPGRGNSVCKGREAQRIEIVKLLSLGNSGDAAGKSNYCQLLRRSLERQTRILYLIPLRGDPIPPCLYLPSTAELQRPRLLHNREHYD